jgi:hypothetical protein
MVTLSTAKAEYLNLTEAGREVLWIQRLLEGAGVLPHIPIVFSDSSNAIALANSLQSAGRNRQRWIDKKLLKGQLKLALTKQGYDRRWTYQGLEERGIQSIRSYAMHEARGGKVCLKARLAWNRRIGRDHKKRGISKGDGRLSI